MSLLVISQAEIAELLSMADCIRLMKDAFAALAKGDVVLPLRPIMKLPDRRGVLAMMPGYLADPETIAAKVITFFPGNIETPHDTHQGAVLLFDPKHGKLVGLLDASEITAIRTAAASAVATDLLALPDAGDLAIIGSGVQAHKHLDAMRAVRDIKRVRVWSRTPERAQRFARREAQRLMIQITVTETAEEAVRDADIVCTVTTAHNPIVSGEWISDGAHINAVGSCAPTERELDTIAVARSRMFVDWRESTLNEAGDFLIPKEEGVIDDSHIVGEIGEILLESVGGRTDNSEITLFKSLGIAVQDAVVAHHVLQKARDTRMGVRVDFGGSR